MKKKILISSTILTIALITTLSVNMARNNNSYFDVLLKNTEALASSELTIDFTKDGQCVCKPKPGPTSVCESGNRVTFRYVCGPLSDTEKPCNPYTSECRR